MKNIHVLPTEKPSRLYQNYYGKYFEICELPRVSTIYKKCYNIYITSDEEIKDEDWMIRPNEQPIKVTKDFFWDFGVRYYKIILTTDQDLIKDGVQAVDDDFLEWFVKNPSCEEVEVKHSFIDFVINDYKIIIPKEEPKQHVEFINNNIDQLDKAIESFKQETLEEVAENYVNNFEYNIAHPRRVAKNAFINGAKWQQEQDKNKYSEEEVIDIAIKYFNHYYNISSRGRLLINHDLEWFKQFKNK